MKFKVTPLVAVILAILTLSTVVSAQPTYADTTSEQKHIESVNKKVKKKDGDTFTGAMVYKNNLVLVLNDDAATSLTGTKSTKALMLAEISKEIYKYQDNTLAKDGILVIGGYVKSDDGREPTVSVYYAKSDWHSSYIDNHPDVYTNRVSEYMKNPTGVLDDATYYYINGLYTKAMDSDFNDKAPFNNISLVKQEGAPDWLLDFNSAMVYPKLGTIVN